MRKKNNKEETILEVKKDNKYNLIEVIIIMIITAICSILITIKVTYVSNGKSKVIKTNVELTEFIDKYKGITKEYYKDLNKKELLDAAIKGMIEYLGDPYSTYMTEDETDNFNLELDGEYVGMGAEITKVDNNIYITRVFANSPAEKYGLKAKDIILKMNNEDVTKLELTELSNKIRGKEGTKFNLTIKRDNKEQTIEMTRSKVEIPSVSSRIIEKNSKKIGLISLTVFANNSYMQFSEEIEKLKNEKVEALIVDVRGNTGGYLTTARSLVDMFLDKNEIICQLETKGKVEKLKAEHDKKIKLPVAVLVNGGSASASEIFTAALKENLNAPIIGTTTYGKGKVQKIETLTSGATIKYTIQSWLTPKGNQIDKVGVKPTVEIELSEDYYKNPTDDHDNQLQKALEIMSK